MTSYSFDIILDEVDDLTTVPTLIRSHLASKCGAEKDCIDIGVAMTWKSRKYVVLDVKTRSTTLKKQIRTMVNGWTELDLTVSPSIRLVPTTVSDDQSERSKQAKGDHRWKTLEHNGPFFPTVSIERLNVPLIYDGTPYELNEKEERVASYFARRIITEETSTKKYIQKKEFVDNFFTDFKTYLTPEHRKIFKKFEKLDFSRLVVRLKEIKEASVAAKLAAKEALVAARESSRASAKEASAKEASAKEANARESSSVIEVNRASATAARLVKLERRLNYSYAFVDGLKKEIRNASVEMPGLYVGSGNVMTHKGKIKQEYFPRDITLNITKGKTPTPPPGSKWGGVVHDHTAIWTARYKDKTTGKYKYILLAETGDLLKFEKARKLNRFMDVVNRRVDELLASKKKVENQIGCALYLIKEYGIRVGNDDGEEDEDTSEKVVGATTLMVQNVTCEDDGTSIHLSFKGKDSVVYENTITVSSIVYRHISSYIEDREEDDCVFDQITSADVNKYLKSIDVDFSAKVFRTRLASSIMHEGLEDLEYDEDATDEEKIADFNSVNRRVAIQLNHKKGLTDAVKARLLKDREAIDVLKKELRGLKKEVKEAESREAGGKEATKLSAKVDKLTKQIKTKELKLRERDQSKEIALDTSKKNYIDPRIVKAWAERVGLDDEESDDEDNEDEEDETERVHGVKKVYTNAHMRHFKWAIDNPAFGADWDYVDTPLDPVVGNRLSPEV